MHDHAEIDFVEDFSSVIWPVLRLTPYFRRAPKAVHFMGYLLDQKRKGESASLQALTSILFARGRSPKDKGLNAIRTLAYRIRSELRMLFETDPTGVSAEYRADVRCFNG